MKNQTHYLPDGKVYTGETHKADGKLMTGKTHTKDSVFLTHTAPMKAGKMVKGSQEAKDYMASMRDKKKKK